MTFVERLWLRLPVVGRAVLIGVAAAAAGTLPWAAVGVGEHQASITAAVGRPADGNVPVVVLALLRAGNGMAAVDSRCARMNARANDCRTKPGPLAGLLGLASDCSSREY